MPVVLDGFAAEEALLDPEMRGAARWRQTMNAGGQRRGGWPRPQVRVGREADAGLPACRKRASGGILS
jgi:hypothetical protein